MANNDMKRLCVNRRDQSIVPLVHTVATLDMLPNFKRLFVDQLLRTNRCSIDQHLLRKASSRHLTRHNVTSIHGCIMNRIRHNAPYIRLGCASGKMRFSPPLKRRDYLGMSPGMAAESIKSGHQKRVWACSKNAWDA